MNAGSRLQAAALVYTLLGTCTAQAFTAGVDWSRFPADTACNACHSGAATPSVSLSGPSTLLRGSIGTFTFTIATGGVVGGLNVKHSVSSATATLLLGGPSSGNTPTPVFQSLNIPYSPTGGSVTSAPYIPTAAGVYRWRASYSGDVNHSPLSGVCDQLGQHVIVVEDDYSFGNGLEAP